MAAPADPHLTTLVEQWTADVTTRDVALRSMEQFNLVHHTSEWITPEQVEAVMAYVVLRASNKVHTKSDELREYDNNSQCEGDYAAWVPMERVIFTEKYQAIHSSTKWIGTHYTRSGDTFTKHRAVCLVAASVDMNLFSALRGLNPTFANDDVRFLNVPNVPIPMSYTMVLQAVQMTLRLWRKIYDIILNVITAENAAMSDEEQKRLAADEFEAMQTRYLTARENQNHTTKNQTRSLFTRAFHMLAGAAALFVSRPIENKEATDIINKLGKIPMEWSKVEMKTKEHPRTTPLTENDVAICAYLYARLYQSYMSRPQTVENIDDMLKTFDKNVNVLLSKRKK